jgi:histidine ammonia-lyase
MILTNIYVFVFVFASIYLLSFAGKVALKLFDEEIKPLSFSEKQGLSLLSATSYIITFLYFAIK